MRTPSGVLAVSILASAVLAGCSPRNGESAEAAPVHLVAWGLEFVGKQLTDLEATGSVAGGPGRKLGTNDEAWHLWKGWKVI